MNTVARALPKPETNNPDPYLQLIRAVMLSAFDSLATTTLEVANIGNRQEARHRASASLYWIESDNEGWPLDYLEVCALLNLKPEVGRRHAREMHRITLKTEMF